MESKKPSQANPLSQAIEESVSSCVTDKLAIALSPILASLEKVRGFSEVSAKGVGMAIDQSKKAADASKKLLEMELEPEPEPEKEKNETSHVLYHPDGRVKSVHCGKKSKTIVWVGERAVSFL